MYEYIVLRKGGQHDATDATVMLTGQLRERESQFTKTDYGIYLFFSSSISPADTVPSYHDIVNINVKCCPFKLIEKAYQWT